MSNHPIDDCYSPDFHLSYEERNISAMYLAGVLLRDLTLNIQPPSYTYGQHFDLSRPSTFYQNHRTRVELFARIYGPVAGSSAFYGSNDPMGNEWDYFHHSIDSFHNLVSECTTDQLITLGPGHRCHHCGEYNPQGELLCWRCGGVVECVDFITPVRFPFKSWQRPKSDGTNWETAMAFYLYAEVDDVNQEILPFFTNQSRLLPTGCRLDTGYYLCKYCGYAVPNGQACPGCGGERVPLMDLISLDNVCRYCGSTMTGGIVCMDCGARISGVAINQLWSNDSHKPRMNSLFKGNYP